MHKFYFEVIILLECSFSVLSSNDLNKRSANINDCVVNIGSTQINLNILNEKDGYEFVQGNNTYILNICGPALKCKHPNASVCIINEKKEITIIGLFNKKPNFQHTKLKYRYYTDKKAEAIIEFKCNRYFKTPFIQFDSQLPNTNIYKFIFHTSVFCVKLPMMCTVFDVENNLQYDISPLYSPKNNWIVRNFTVEVKVYLNLCGKLHLIKSKNDECGHEGTQICAVDQFGKATNLGVFSTDLKVNNNGLSVNITGGSLCGNNISTVVTKIDFICSVNDTGPILIFSSDCEYNIAWHTPSACPYYSSINKDCKYQFRYGTKNELYLPAHREQQLSATLKMKYNICGVRNDTCNGQKNVSFCLVNKNQEIIFGINNNAVITKDASVYMNLTGELCSNKNLNRSVNINFQCDYTPDKSEEISISKDLCTANVTVFTTKVCREPDAINTSCIAPVNETHYYDLTPLMLKNHNYEVNDPDDSSKVYILNVCLPVVFGTNALCELGSAVCLRNNAEPNKYKRFKSVGNYMKSSGLIMQSDKLIIQYDGTVCPGSRPDYKSVIEFRCVESQKKSDIKLIKTDCLYTFIWNTPYACLISENNTNTDSKIAINNESVGKFANPEVANIHKNDEKDITSAHTVIEDTIQETTVLNNIKHELESTTHNKMINDAISTPTISMYVPVEVPSSSGIFLKNCTLRNHINELSQYNMYSLPRVTHVHSKSGKLYSVNICHQQSQMCTSMRCLTNIHIVLDQQYVIVNFTEKTKCKNSPYNSVIIMKCSHEFEKPVVIQEQECSVQLEWKNAAACAFLKSESHYESSTGKIVVILLIATVFVIVIIAIIGRYYFVRKRRCTDSTQLLVQYSRVKDTDKIA